MRKNRSRAPQTRSLQLASVAAAPWVPSVGHPEEKENELKELVHPSCRKPWRREGMAKSALWSRVCDTGFGRQAPTIEGSLTTGLFV